MDTDGLKKVIQEGLKSIKENMATKEGLEGLEARVAIVEENMAPKEDLEALRQATAKGFEKTHTHLKNLAKGQQEIKEEIRKLQETQAIIVGEHGERIKRLEEQHPELPPYESPFR